MSVEKKLLFSIVKTEDMEKDKGVEGEIVVKRKEGGLLIKALA